MLHVSTSQDKGIYSCIWAITNLFNGKLLLHVVLGIDCGWSKLWQPCFFELHPYLVAVLSLTRFREPKGTFIIHDAARVAMYGVGQW